MIVFESLKNLQGRICTYLASVCPTFAVRILVPPLAFPHCHTNHFSSLSQHLLLLMVRTKQTAKKCSGGKASRVEISKTIQQILAQQAMAQQVKQRRKNKVPTIRIPATKRPATPAQPPQGPIVSDYTSCGTRLTYISFVFCARTVDGSTSAATARVPCVRGAYRSQKHICGS